MTAPAEASLEALRASLEAEPLSADTWAAIGELHSSLGETVGPATAGASSVCWSTGTLTGTSGRVVG